MGRNAGASDPAKPIDNVISREFLGRGLAATFPVVAQSRHLSIVPGIAVEGLEPLIAFILRTREIGEVPTVVRTHWMGDGEAIERLGADHAEQNKLEVPNHRRRFERLTSLRIASDIGKENAFARRQ